MTAEEAFAALAPIVERHPDYEVRLADAHDSPVERFIVGVGVVWVHRKMGD